MKLPAVRSPAREGWRWFRGTSAFDADSGGSIVVLRENS